MGQSPYRNKSSHLYLIMLKGVYYQVFYFTSFHPVQDSREDVSSTSNREKEGGHTNGVGPVSPFRERGRERGKKGEG